MNSYYLTLVLKPDLEEKARKELISDVENKLQAEKGKQHTPSSRVKTDLWGARDLAYPIKKQTKGYYAHFVFETDPKIAKDLDNSLRVEDDILRYLLVRT